MWIQSKVEDKIYISLDQDVIMDAISHDTLSPPLPKPGHCPVIQNKQQQKKCQRLMNEIITVFSHTSYIQNGPQPVRPPHLNPYQD